jgi:hypothetical protein
MRLSTIFRQNGVDGCFVQEKNKKKKKKKKKKKLDFHALSGYIVCNAVSIATGKPKPTKSV